MHLEAHAGLGWLVGLATPGSDRRLRGWCVAAAVLPDVDAVSYFAGEVAYGRWHHTFGHNLALGAALLAFAAWRWRDRGRGRAALASAAVLVSFLLHLLTDMKLSAYPVHLLWPFVATGYEFDMNYGIGAPINRALAYAGALSFFVLAPLRGVTGLELLSVELDRRFLNAFRRKPLTCAFEGCARRTNETCHGCGAPRCQRHAKLARGFRVACGGCPTRV